MCGRAYIIYTREALWKRYINEQSVHLADIASHYNITPSQKLTVLRIKDGKRQFDHLQWGLVPHWSKENPPRILINSRVETLIEKPGFRNILLRNRCIVPLSGFYEWKQEGRQKRPFCVFLKNKNIMSVAGIWDVYISEAGKAVESFSIITAPANELVGNIHDRMPCILKERDEQDWLDPNCQDLKYLTSLLHQYPSQELSAYEISTLVNSPKLNSADLLKPIEMMT